jgi:hypothetical protein
MVNWWAGKSIGGSLSLGLRVRGLLSNSNAWICSTLSRLPLTGPGGAVRDNPQMKKTLADMFALGRSALKFLATRNVRGRREVPHYQLGS